MSDEEEKNSDELSTMTLGDDVFDEVEPVIADPLAVADPLLADIPADEDEDPLKDFMSEEDNLDQWS